MQLAGQLILAKELKFISKVITVLKLKTKVAFLNKNCGSACLSHERRYSMYCKEV